jgi:anti-anti-sigma regulatory factor/PAS domain-containing protein
MDGPAIPRDSKWTPLAGFLPKEPEALEVALLLYELHKRTDSALWAIAKDGTILLSEGSALAHFGIKPGQIVGLNAFQIYPPGSRALEQTTQVLNGESLRIDNLEAGQYWVSWAEPVRDDLGAVTGMVGHMCRVNENSADTLQAKLLLGVVEKLPIAIWSMERDGTCTLSTGQGLRDLGLEPHSLVGANLFEVYASNPQFKQDMDRVFNGEELVTTVNMGDMVWRNRFIPQRGPFGDVVERMYAFAENITETTQNERRLEEQLALIQSQKNAIASLTSPIIEVWQGVLVGPVIGSLDEASAGRLLERLLQEVVSRQSNSVILDLTGVEVVESATAEHLFAIMRSVELLGAQGVVSGIRPSVAKTMVELDIKIASQKTYPRLSEALRKLIGARKNQ